MLVLTRKTQQQIHIGDNITITIVRVKGQSVRVGIEAPQDVRVIRGELAISQDKPKRQSARSHAASQAASMEIISEPATPPCHGSNASTSQRQPAVMEVDQKTCVDVRRRVPGASLAPLIRRSQRLGPASVGALSGR